MRKQPSKLNLVKPIKAAVLAPVLVETTRKEVGTSELSRLVTVPKLLQPPIVLLVVPIGGERLVGVARAGGARGEAETQMLTRMLVRGHSSRELETRMLARGTSSQRCCPDQIRRGPLRLTRSGL